jgi:hypothetical protein
MEPNASVFGFLIVLKNVKKIWQNPLTFRAKRSNIVNGKKILNETDRKTRNIRNLWIDKALIYLNVRIKYQAE